MDAQPLANDNVPMHRRLRTEVVVHMFTGACVHIDMLVAQRMEALARMAVRLVHECLN